MGCTHSKQVAPAPSPPSTRSLPVAGSNTTVLGTRATDVERCEAPPALDRVIEAKEKVEYVADAAGTIVSTACAIIDAAPPDVVDALASGVTTAASAAAQYTAENAPGLATFLGQLCGSAVDLLGAIAPAVPFGGVAAAVIGLIAEQGAAYAQAYQAAHALRQTIADRRTTIEEFARSASLAAKHSGLVGHAAQALRDAVALLAESYAQSGHTKLRKEVFKFFTAKGGLQALQDAAAQIEVRSRVGRGVGLGLTRSMGTSVASPLCRDSPTLPAQLPPCQASSPWRASPLRRRSSSLSRAARRSGLGAGTSAPPLRCGSR